MIFRVYGCEICFIKFLIYSLKKDCCVYKQGSIVLLSVFFPFRSLHMANEEKAKLFYKTFSILNVNLYVQQTYYFQTC